MSHAVICKLQEVIRDALLRNYLPLAQSYLMQRKPEDSLQPRMVGGNRQPKDSRFLLTYVSFVVMAVSRQTWQSRTTCAGGLNLVL